MYQQGFQSLLLGPSKVSGHPIAGTAFLLYFPESGSIGQYVFEVVRPPECQTGER